MQDKKFPLFLSKAIKDNLWVTEKSHCAEYVCDEVVEVKIPFEDLGVRHGEKIDFFPKREIITFDYIAESKDALFYTFVVLCVKRGLLTFCRKFQADKSNCNYDNFVEYDDLFLEDYSCDVEREVMFSEIIKEIWSIVYDFPFEYICAVLPDQRPPLCSQQSG